METHLVYDFLNAHAEDTALQSRLGELDSGSDDEYIRTIARAAEERDVDLSVELVGAWLAEAFAEYDSWIDWAG